MKSHLAVCARCNKRVAQFDVQNDDFVERLIAASAVFMQAEKLPREFGPYRLLKLLGEGGMGRVYLAEELEKPIRRKLAVKIVNAVAEAGQIAARFVAECQALGLMNHNNIAKIYAAGMADSQPFLAMEYIEGKTLGEYCQKQKPDLKQRLLLLKQVCIATQHAHQNLVLHRDLKPGNILVSGGPAEPVVKVIDFGLAKALSGQIKLGYETLTEFGKQVVGTPAYMSPEQAESGNVDTRTDVYSLGIILFELLTGETPFSASPARDLDTLREAKSEGVPKPRSFLKGRLEKSTQNPDACSLKEIGSDLDWICIKATRNSREERYATASEFEADLERYLKDMPVIARQSTMKYWLTKAYQRHKAKFLIATMLLISLASGLAGTTYFAVESSIAANEACESKKQVDLALGRERAARIEAEENLNLARKSVDRFFTLVSQNELINLPEFSGLRIKLLSEALEYYKAFVVLDASLSPDLAATHFRLAQTSFDPKRPLTLWTTTQHFLKGLDLLEELLDREPRIVEWGALREGAYVGRMRFTTGKKPEIPRFLALWYLPIAERSCGLWQQLCERLPGENGARNDLAGMYNVRALIEHSAKLWDRSVRSYNRSIDIWQELAEGEPMNINYQSELATAHANLAKVYKEEYDENRQLLSLERALASQREAVRLHHGIVERSADASFVIDLSSSSRDLAKLEAARGQPAKGIGICEDAERLLQEKLGSRTPFAIEMRELASVRREIESASANKSE